MSEQPEKKDTSTQSRKRRADNAHNSTSHLAAMLEQASKKAKKDAPIGSIELTKADKEVFNKMAELLKQKQDLESFPLPLNKMDITVIQREMTILAEMKEVMKTVEITQEKKALSGVNLTQDEITEKNDFAIEMEAMRIRVEEKKNLLDNDTPRTKMSRETKKLIQEMDALTEKSPTTTYNIRYDTRGGVNLPAAQGVLDIATRPNKHGVETIVGMKASYQQDLNQIQQKLFNDFMKTLANQVGDILKGPRDPSDPPAAPRGKTLTDRVYAPLLANQINWEDLAPIKELKNLMIKTTNEVGQSLQNKMQTEEIERYKSQVSIKCNAILSEFKQEKMRDLTTIVDLACGKILQKELGQKATIESPANNPQRPMTPIKHR